MSLISQNINSLRTKSDIVSSVNEAKEIVEKLRTQLGKISNGVGLSAIQIGIPKQVAVAKIDKTEHVLINPVVLEKSEEFIYINEGCLSLPNVFLDTYRYRHFVIKNMVIDGDSFREETQYFYYEPPDKNGSDIMSIAVQHEIDHFDGKLIQDFKIKSSPIVIQEKKQGRNDLCACGSGKKYKKCCG